MANMLTNNINRKYFAFLLKNNRRYIFLYGFALLIAFPVFVASLSTTTTHIESLYYVGKILSLLIVIAGTVLIPLLLFQFTTSRRSVDVFHALPIQKEFLFMTNYFAGIAMLLIPYLLSTVLGVVVCLFLGMDSISVALEVQNFLLTSLALLVSYSITTFAKKNCGTIVDAFLYTIALNLIPILAYVTYYWFCSQILLGFNEPFSNEVFYYLTPFPAMFIYSIRNLQETWVTVPAAAFVFYGFIVIFLYVICSYLFVNHKSERTNIPFVNRYFYPIVSFISTTIAIILIHTFMNTAFDYDGISTYIFHLLVGAIFYLVLDVIANRGFKHLPKTLMRIGFISVVVLAIVVPTRMTNGFGYITRLPDVEDIDSVTLELDYSLSSMLGFSNYNYGNNAVTFTDPKEIEVIHSIHEEILSQYATVGYNKNDFYRYLSQPVAPYENTYSTTTIQLNYDLGLTKMKRQYYVSTQWMLPLMDLITSDAMIDGRYPMVVQSEKYTKTSLWLTDPFDTSKNILYHSLMSIDWDIDDFMDALEKDLKNETNEEYFDSTNQLVGYLGIKSNSLTRFEQGVETMIPIKSSYVNTLQFLEANKYDLPDPNLDKWITSKFVLAYPDREERRLAFFWNSNMEYYEKTQLNNFSYKNVEFSELKQLLPLVHQSIKTTEPNLLLYVQDSQGNLKSYSIRYKDIELVNTIVKSELYHEINGIYDLMYQKQMK